MPEYLDDPSVLTKDKLKIELLANNVELPGANATKDVYVQLYLKNLTAQNARNVSSLDGFSSDEEPPPPVVRNASRSSGRKATRKTDKVQSEGLDVAELTAEGLKDELLKYGVDAGPIVASTRRVYEKKLLRLLDESVSPASPDLQPTETEANHNGHADLDQFSDKEEEETRVIPEPEPEVIPEPEPLPEPIPLVERLVRSRGKTPVTTRTRSSQHNKQTTSDALEDDDEVLNVKRRYRRSSYRVIPVPTPPCQTVGPNNVCSVLGDEPQPRPLVSQAKTDPAPSPSLNTQRSSEDSAAVRRNSVVLKAWQPPTVKTPKIKPSEAPWPSPGSHQKDQSSNTAPPRLMEVPLDTTLLEMHQRIHQHSMTPEKERTNAHLAKGKQQKITPFLSDLSPVKRHGCVAVVSKESYFNKVEKAVAVDQTPRAQERDVLKEVFANDINSPTGIIASCRKPIRGAAGRPIQPSDFWNNENLLLSPKSISTTTSSTSTYSETRHRSTNLSLSPPSSSSASRLVSIVPPAGQTKAARCGFSIWLKLFFLVLLASFLFFVYQTMEAEILSPFGSSETGEISTEGTA